MSKKVSGSAAICHNALVDELEPSQRWLRPRGPVERFVDGNSIQLLKDGRAAFPKMLESIAAASRRVWLEIYWIDSDTVGRRFFHALELAARRGVHVRLMYDAFGSFGTEADLFRGLSTAGAEVVEFSPLSPFQKRFGLERLTRRNHRKVLIVDEHAFVGGLNINDRWLPREQGGDDWRDDVARVSGPVVKGLARVFESSWRESGGNPSRGAPLVCGKTGDAKVAVLAQAKFRRRRQTLDAYLTRLQRARKHVFISNAYFVPNPRIVRALVGAARRGADVRIMLPAKSDVEIIRHASMASWNRLLRDGVRIFQWQPTILHSKTAVIDGRWATVGSFNLDYISVLNNAELNLSVLDSHFARDVTDSFLEDQKQCSEVLWEGFRVRPVLDKAMSRTLYWFRHWL